MKFAHLLALSFTLISVEQTVAQAATPSQKKGWYILSNAPGWKGYGVINENGWLLPERFQNIQTGEIQESQDGEEAKSENSANRLTQSEELGPEQQVYIAEYGGYCVGQKILKGQPGEVGKWRVKYKVNTPDGNYTYKARGVGAESYAANGHWFVNWLNGVRAQYGLGAVGYDPNLENWAAQNNNQQAARGLGHYVMGPARRQNAAMGSADMIGSMWLASPGHRAALLDPTISFIGLAGAGAWWTFNAY